MWAIVKSVLRFTVKRMYPVSVNCFMGGEGGLIIYFVVPLYFVLLSAPEKGGRVTIKFTSENPRLARPALLICSRRLAYLGGAGH